MTTKPSIGFIGLGLMGQAFTKRLVAADYAVTGFDIAAEKVAQATKHGVIAAISSADVTSKSDVVLLCVVSTDAVHEACYRVARSPSFRAWLRIRKRRAARAT